MNNKKYTVLIADSDLHSVKKLEERFLIEGFRVFSVNSGRDAVLCMRKRNINIAIIDVNLKDMKGYTIVPLLKDINKDIKVIITTFRNSVELEGKCRETGIILYAIKPLDYTQIVKITKSAQENHREFIDELNDTTLAKSL
ncbi:hypothetical protein AMJ80_01245 [bacterium SM23_31]|nr:MAG: hypothetical protein AMJ80_01245 [bacterium SM23_31]